MEAESIAEGVDELTHYQLRLGILGAYQRHLCATGGIN
jgi:hypothetical protein